MYVNEVIGTSFWSVLECLQCTMGIAFQWISEANGEKQKQRK